MRTGSYHRVKRVESMGAFALHSYPVVLSGEIKSKFTKIGRSFFVAAFIWSQDIAARICLYFLPMRDGFVTRSLHRNKTDFILTDFSAGYCY